MSRSCGFTLVEALIAVGVFAVVILALSALLSTTIGSNRRLNIDALMLSIAKDTIEKIQMEALNSNPTTFGSVGVAYIGPTDLTVSGKQFRRTTTLTPRTGPLGNVNRKEIDVTVTYMEGGLVTNRSVTLSTIVAPQLP